MTICHGSGPSVSTSDAEGELHIANAAAATRTETTSRSREAILTRLRRSIDLINIDRPVASSLTSLPLASPQLRINEKRLMPTTPERAPIARNAPIAEGDSPIVIKYAVRTRTTPDGANAVRYRDASERVRRGKPEG